MLSVVRATWARYIAENPYTMISYIRPTKDNGFGIQIPDMTKVAVSTTIGTIRVSRRRLPEPAVANAKTPYDYVDVYYLLAEYDLTALRKGLVFEYYGKKYRTGIVENRIIHSGIAYKICDLEEVTSFDAGDVYG